MEAQTRKLIRQARWKKNNKTGHRITHKRKSGRREDATLCVVQRRLGNRLNKNGDEEVLKKSKKQKSSEKIQESKKLKKIQETKKVLIIQGTKKF